MLCRISMVIDEIAAVIRVSNPPQNFLWQKLYLWQNSIKKKKSNGVMCERGGHGLEPSRPIHLSGKINWRFMLSWHVNSTEVEHHPVGKELLYVNDEVGRRQIFPAYLDKRLLYIVFSTKKKGPIIWLCNMPHQTFTFGLSWTNSITWWGIFRSLY